MSVGVNTAAAGVLASVTLVATPALAFRTGGDLSDFDHQALIAQPTNRIFIDRGGKLPRNLDPALVDLAAQRAAETWSVPGCTALRLNYVGPANRDAAPEDGHNSIQWVNDWKARGYPKDSPGATDVQYVKDDAGHWIIVEADIYLNLNFDWTTGVPTDDSKSVQAVLTHEFGHGLGLLHPCELDGSDGAPLCSDSPALSNEEMYPVYTPDQISLSDDDVAGVCFLYPAGCNDDSCPEGSQCIAGSCQSLCGDVVCPESTTCVRGRCVASHQDCGNAGCVSNPCDTTADCGRHEFCDGSVCSRGGGALGDRCSSAIECFDGACVSGACAESCSPGEECRSGECDLQTNACTDARAPMGAECRFSTDCIGGYCVEQDGANAVCSRSCAMGQAACPAAWECRRAEGVPVCAPQAPETQGCSVGNLRSSRVPWLAVTLSLSLSCLSRRRRSFKARS